MMETTSEQFKLLKINMKELVFPHLHKPIEKINELLTKINQHPVLQKGIFSAIIGTIGIGLVLTTLGTATMLVGKLVKGYGEFLGYARDLTPVLMKNSIKLLEFLGLNTSAHNLTFGSKIKASGNPLGIDLSTFSLKSGLMADIRRIDKNLKEGIVRGFKELPANISRSAVALKDWTVTSIRAIPANFTKGLIAFKNGFLGIPSMIGKAIMAFRAFSVTLLTSPIGWIALAIGAVVFVIYKYWKPITGFFRGLWNGLKAGLQPLMPVFKQVIEALQPIIKPIKAIIDWIKKVIKPVEDTGGAAEKMGEKFGKAIADIILKIAKLVTKIFEFGQKIGDMLAKGIRSKKKDTEGAINEHAQIIRDHLPHSPAKTGPLKDLNKLKIIETIVSTMKPAPLVNAMNKNLGLMISGAKGSFGRVGIGGGASFVVNYSPTISMPSGTSKDEFSQLLKKHKDEVVALLKREFERKERLAY